MPIPITNYVDITSVVGGGNAVQTRNFGGRIFTTNTLLPPGTISSYTSSQLPAIGQLYGTSSPEYLRAQSYFAWVSKNGIRPQSISYSRWTNVDTAPYIIGAVLTQTLATYTAISNGSFRMTIGGVTNNFTGIDLTAAGSLAAVAADIQTVIRTGTGVMWTSAVVTFDSTRGSFDFTGGSAVAATISVAPEGTGTDLSVLIGWLAGAIIGNGTLAETLTQTLTNSYSTNNGFGGFVFIYLGFTLLQVEEISAWTDSLNVQVMYCPPVIMSNVTTYAAGLANYSGVGLTVSPLTLEYPDQIPMTVWAAIDYTQPNAVQNFEFQVFPWTPSVTDGITQTTFDALSVNYYGQTQNNGNVINFYQTGVLFGPSTAPTDMGAFVNEVWLKSSITAQIMGLLLALSEIPANTQGLSQISGIVQPVLAQGLINGVISVGKLLTPSQQAYITSVTGDPLAWQQVQKTGFWFNPVIVPIIRGNGSTGYQINYTLVYGSSVGIRKVTGTDIQV